MPGPAGNPEPLTDVDEAPTDQELVEAITKALEIMGLDYGE